MLPFRLAVILSVSHAVALVQYMHHGRYLCCSLDCPFMSSDGTKTVLSLLHAQQWHIWGPVHLATGALLFCYIPSASECRCAPHIFIEDVPTVLIHTFSFVALLSLTTAPKVWCKCIPPLRMDRLSQRPHPGLTAFFWPESTVPQPPTGQVVKHCGSLHKGRGEGTFQTSPKLRPTPALEVWILTKSRNCKKGRFVPYCRGSQMQAPQDLSCARCHSLPCSVFPHSPAKQKEEDACAVVTHSHRCT